MPKKKTITVEYSEDLKFKGHAAIGLSYGGFCVGIDKKLKGKKLMEVLIHECLHELWPKADEKEIEQKAAILTRTMWKEGFRKIDNHSRAKMQDEK